MRNIVDKFINLEDIKEEIEFKKPYIKQGLFTFFSPFFQLLFYII